MNVICLGGRVLGTALALDLARIFLGILAVAALPAAAAPIQERTGSDEHSDNAVRKMQDFDQSIWLDVLSRELIESGTLQGLSRTTGCAASRNPSIFEGHRRQRRLQRRIAGLPAGPRAHRDLQTLAVEISRPSISSGDL